MFTGYKISGVEAAEMRLVLKSVPDEQLNAEVKALATRMALVPINQLAMQKMVTNAAVEEKISQIQGTLQNMATLMVGYPDASEDQSKRWLDTLNVCRVELRRRHQSSQVRLAPKTGGD